MHPVESAPFLPAMEMNLHGADNESDESDTVGFARTPPLFFVASGFSDVSEMRTGPETVCRSKCEIFVLMTFYFTWTESNNYAFCQGHVLSDRPPASTIGSPGRRPQNQPKLSNKKLSTPSPLATAQAFSQDSNMTPTKRLATRLGSPGPNIMQSRGISESNRKRGGRKCVIM